MTAKNTQSAVNLWGIALNDRLIYAGCNFNKCIRYFDKLKAKLGDKITMLHLPKLQREDSNIIAMFDTVATATQVLEGKGLLECQTKEFCGEKYYLFCSGWINVGWTQNAKHAAHILASAKHSEFYQVLRSTNVN
jgi:hypothetical protein